MALNYLLLLSNTFSFFAKLADIHIMCFLVWLVVWGVMYRTKFANYNGMFRCCNLETLGFVHSNTIFIFQGWLSEKIGGDRGAQYYNYNWKNKIFIQSKSMNQFSRYNIMLNLFTASDFFTLQHHSYLLQVSQWDNCLTKKLWLPSLFKLRYDQMAKLPNQQ